MFFHLFSSVGQRKIFWVPMRNRTSDLRSMESEGLRCDSSWRLQFFSLFHACDKMKKHWTYSNIDSNSSMSQNTENHFKESFKFHKGALQHVSMIQLSHLVSPDIFRWQPWEVDLTCFAPQWRLLNRAREVCIGNLVPVYKRCVLSIQNNQGVHWD